MRRRNNEGDILEFERVGHIFLSGGCCKCGAACALPPPPCPAWEAEKARLSEIVVKCVYCPENSLPGKTVCAAHHESPPPAPTWKPLMEWRIGRDSLFLDNINSGERGFLIPHIGGWIWLTSKPGKLLQVGWAASLQDGKNAVLRSLGRLFD